MVVHKDVDVPNTGREATSYLWAIHKLYPEIQPETLIACLQGWPFHHGTNLDILGHEIPPGYHMIGDGIHVSDGNGGPHHSHPRLPIAETYEAWVEIPFPGTVKFVAGAQFIVSGDRVLRWHRQKYQEMIDNVNNLELGPWVMERLWGPFFGG
jgi:hypothetical protein